MQAKQSALDVLAKQGIFQPPVNPAEIARSMGVSVHFVTFNNQEIVEKVSGFYDAEDDAIYVNTDEVPLRQTFTIAHELGHRILHREWAESEDYKMLFRQESDSNDSKNDPKEKEANTFAANLLVPRYILNNYYNIASLEKLSRLFVVSVPLIKNRLSFEYGI